MGRCVSGWVSGGGVYLYLVKKCFLLLVTAWRKGCPKTQCRVVKANMNGGRAGALAIIVATTSSRYKAKQLLLVGCCLVAMYCKCGNSVFILRSHNFSLFSLPCSAKSFSWNEKKLAHFFKNVMENLSKNIPPPFKHNKVNKLVNKQNKA